MANIIPMKAISMAIYVSQAIDIEIIKLMCNVIYKQ